MAEYEIREIDEACLRCGEVVYEDEDRRSILDGMTGRRRWQHFECAMRMAIGSVAHVEGRCSCFVAGSEEGDAPDLSRRQAARAAWSAHQRRVESALPRRPE